MVVSALTFAVEQIQRRLDRAAEHGQDVAAIAGLYLDASRAAYEGLHQELQQIFADAASLDLPVPDRNEQIAELHGRIETYLTVDNLRTPLGNSLAQLTALLDSSEKAKLLDACPDLDDLLVEMRDFHARLQYEGDAASGVAPEQLMYLQGALARALEGPPLGAVTSFAELAGKGRQAVEDRDWRETAQRLARAGTSLQLAAAG